MATRKVTITLDEDQLERIRALVNAGTASSVPGFETMLRLGNALSTQIDAQSRLAT